MAITYLEQKGTLECPTISHSLMNLIDPMVGGHPMNFEKAILGAEVLDTPSIDKGNLIHYWMEHEDSFAIAELDKPAEQMAKFAECFYDIYFNEGYKRLDLTEKLVIQLDESFVINEIFSSFAGKKADNDEFQLIARSIFGARKEAQVDKRLKNPTILAKFQTECMPYIRFLKQASGKIIIDRSTKDMLNKCKENLREHKQAQELINLCTNKEVEHFWVDEKFKLNRKIKVDRYYINLDTREMIILDFKTTSKPVGSFARGDESSYHKYRLGRQLTNYAWGIFNKYNIDWKTHQDFKVSLYNIVFQTTDNCPIMIYKTSPKRISDYSWEIENTLNRIQWHITHGVWNITMEEVEKGFVLL